jgi:transglutaminase/protease-like cytokinesis protein 3
MYCLECGNKLTEGSKFCNNCGSKLEFSNSTDEQYDNTQRKVDDYIRNIDEKNKNTTLYENIYYLMDCVHNNLSYDEQLRGFAERKDFNEGIFKGFYDYKNSAEEVAKNRKGTCIGFSNTFKNLCDKSRIECKIMTYKNDNRKFYHQLNIVFDKEKKYYVDPTWGFIVDNLDDLKKIYRGEINNPRTNQKINILPSNNNNLIEKANSKDTNFMTIVFLSIPALILILLIIRWFLNR